MKRLAVVIGLVLILTLSIGQLRSTLETLERLEAERTEMWERLAHIREQVQDLNTQIDMNRSKIEEYSQYDWDKVEWIYENKEFLEEEA